MTVTLNDIKAAATRIADGIYHSPCPPSEPLSIATGCRIYCKLEYLQRTGSFKERGARNALLLLDDAKRKAGVIAASAGNHALGLAYHAKLLKIPVTVVMPKFAPLTKVNNCRQMGAQVILHGEEIEQCRDHAMELAGSRGLTYIHGYDADAIIAGQGTLGLEILEQVPDVEAIIVPVGGAGLIAGLSLAVKSLKPDVTIIGAEPEHVASMTVALAAGKPVRCDYSPTLVDGLGVPTVGPNAFAIARQYVDKVVTVSERAIALAVLRLIELEKGVVEGAGATPLAACLEGKVPELAGKKVVLPLCGGNIDTSMLGRIIERGMAADGRLCRFTATISDRPGGLARFATVVADAGVSVKEIIHDRPFTSTDLTSVDVHCVVETRDRAHFDELRNKLMEAGFVIKVNQYKAD